MASLRPPLASYARLFADVGVSIDLLECLDEESWAELFEGDLAGVEEGHREALVAAVPAIIAAAAEADDTL